MIIKQIKFNNKPLIFSAKKTPLNLLKSKLKPARIINNYKLQLEDLFLIRNPKYKFIKDYQKDLNKFLKRFNLAHKGNYVFFPWDKTLIHILEESLLFEVRTARNIYLLTKEEQEKFYKARIGIVGLSVGSHIALTLTMCGGPKFMKLADNDEISLSNLNRLRYPLSSLGENKAIYVAKQIYEMNPYAKIELYPQGINDSNIEQFLLKPKKIDILIEEMDNLRLKIKIREFAKKFRIPVIMAADHADNILVDIERYDLNPSYPILHSLLGNLKADEIKNLKPKSFIKLTAKIAGTNLATPNMLYSLLEVGKTIYSWSQLGNAATLCGAIVTYLTKEIILGKSIKSGRILVNIDKIFGNIPKDFKKRQRSLLNKLNNI